MFFDGQKGKMGSTNLNALVFELASGPLLDKGCHYLITKGPVKLICELSVMKAAS